MTEQRIAHELRIPPQPNERILVIGPNSTRFAIVLAKRFRTTHVTTADSIHASIDRDRRTPPSLDLVLQFAALDQPLPFAALIVGSDPAKFKTLAGGAKKAP